MICKECIYFDQDHHCGKHVTYTESQWRCSSGLKQDNRTPEEVENNILIFNKNYADIKKQLKLHHDIESKVHGQHPVQDNLAWTPTFDKDISTDIILNYQTKSDEVLSDPVNHPSHYTDGSIEVIDFIEDKKLPYHLGNAVKYISRAGKKDSDKTIEDLKKAAWYINRYIELLSK